MHANIKTNRQKIISRIVYVSYLGSYSTIIHLISNARIKVIIGNVKNNNIKCHQYFLLIKSFSESYYIF